MSMHKYLLAMCTSTTLLATCLALNLRLDLSIAWQHKGEYGGQHSDS